MLSDPARLRALADTGLDAARTRRSTGSPGWSLTCWTCRSRWSPGLRRPAVLPGAVGLPEPWSERRQTPLSHSFCQHVVDIEAPMVLPDARLYPACGTTWPSTTSAWSRTPDAADRPRRPGARLALRHRQQTRAWTAAQLRTLADLAAACSSELRLRIALDGAQEARLRVVKAHERLELLAGVSETLAGTWTWASRCAGSPPPWCRCSPTGACSP
ncbi:hypothetical protein NKG94_26490 [Micromonospora sp. M12]